MILPLVLLTGLWTVLWRDPSWGTALGGLVAAGVVVAIVPSHRGPGGHRIRPVPLLRLIGYVCVQVVVSNLQIARDVLRWTSIPRGGLVVVRLPTASTQVLAVTAHLVTLTPGTLTVDADRCDGVLVIHALRAGDPAAVEMSVATLARFVADALEPAASSRKATAC